MKHIKIWALLILALTACGKDAPPMEGGDPQVTALQKKVFQTFYVPTGYDDNDSVQIAAEGAIESSCESLTGVRVKIDAEHHLIRFWPVLGAQPEPCTEEGASQRIEAIIDLGRLPAGEYSLHQGDQDQASGRLPIRAATSARVDDFDFAPVSQLEFKSYASGGGFRVSGAFANDCTAIVDMPISIEGNVIVVQPRTERRSGPCEQKPVPFQAVSYLDFMTPGRYLMQIRSEGGKALNRIIEIR